MTQSHRISTLVTYGLLTSAAGVTFLLPGQLSVPATMAAAGPDQVHLTGIVRDFIEAYPDMEVMPGGGFGHYAGNVGLNLDGDSRPVFVAPGGGGGFTVPTTNVVAHWTFDDGSGTTAADKAGPNNGTLMNGPTWTTGPEGGALRFDGVNDYVNVPSSPEIRVTGDMTIAGWFKLDADFDATSATSQILVERYQDDEHNMMIALIGADCKRPDLPLGSLCFKVEHGPTTMEFRYKWTNRRSWTAGTWYHFACTIHSTDSASNDILIDGVDDTDPADLGSMGLINTDYPADMRIGGRNGDFYVIPEAYLEGVMDDVMMYDVALEESDFDLGTGGFKVTDQWRDSATNPIAPHLFGSTSGSLDGFQGVGTSGTIKVLNGGKVLAAPGHSLVVSSNQSSGGPIVFVQKAGSVIDGDVFVGTGGNPASDITTVQGGVISGLRSTLVEPLPFPTVEVPDLGPTVGNRTYSGTQALSGDLHVDNLTINASAVLNITGPTRIVCDNLCTFSNNSQVQVSSGGSLEVFVLGNYLFQNAAQINTTSGDPALVMLYNLGSTASVLENDVTVVANYYSPSTRLTIDNASTLIGNFVGQKLVVQKNGSSFIAKGAFGPVGGVKEVCSVVLADTEGTAGSAESGGITDEASFDAWYRDVPGTNLSVGNVVTLTDDGTGVFEFLTNAFYPIDKQLFGNEGNVHNYHFTFDLASDFTFAACTGQFIEFEGGDGVWLFIDGFLAIDLGGMATGTPQHIEIDRLTEELGLVDGDSYRMHLFYAQRTASSPSTFKLRTNLDLSTESILPAVSAAFD